MKEYLTKASIAKISYSAYEGEEPPHEGHLSLLVRTHKNQDVKLECFMYGEILYKLYSEKAKEGDNIQIRLVMSSYDYTKPFKSKKQTKKLIKGEYFYIIHGEIIKLRPHPSYSDSEEVILDCGVYIFTRIKKNSGLNVGNYTVVRGRLDAHLL